MWPDSGSPARAPRVLVVDRDRDSGEAVEALFRLSGMTVALAESVSEALKILSDFPTDVVVTDLTLPRQDGFDLLREVRHFETRTGRRIPVIAVTALADHPEISRQIRPAGFYAWFLKPVSARVLVSA